MSAMSQCEHCGALAPQVFISPGAEWDRILELLGNNQRALAAWELAAVAGCSRDTAGLWLAHLEHCLKSWPLGPNEAAVVQEAEAAFASVPKPEHFTNYLHCGECLEHDETLRRNSRENISRSEFGRPGWSPIGFCSAHGLMYYFPALARCCFRPNLFGDEDLREMVTHAIGPKGRGAEMLALADSRQRRAIAGLALWLNASEVSGSDALVDLWT